MAVALSHAIVRARVLLIGPSTTRFVTCVDRLDGGNRADMHD